MTTYQKQAIMVLMNLYDDNHIDEEQYFLLLDFVISDTRNEIKISEYPWYEVKPPFDMPITVMYGCGTDAITYAQDGITLKTTPDPCNKIEEEGQ